MRGNSRKTLTRRKFVASSAAAASATMTAAPFVRTAHAAGKLTLAHWDHWVPTASRAGALCTQMVGGSAVDHYGALART
jgi:hypothetical protein